MALTNDKLVIVGAAGMIGSNMVQSALMMGLTSDICLYDVFSPEGVAEEMRQSGFGNVNIVATTDVKEAFTDAKYIISSGGAPRKDGMTREDLLAGNCKIAEELGRQFPQVGIIVAISQTRMSRLRKVRNYRKVKTTQREPSSDCFGSHAVFLTLELGKEKAPRW